MYFVNFVIQGLPKTTNSGGREHWAMKAKEARLWKQKVRIMLKKELPDAPLEKAKLTLTRCSAIEPDYDGLVSSFKHIIDGLVDAHVLLSDKRITIGAPTYLWKKAPQKQGYVIVQVEELCETT